MCPLARIMMPVTHNKLLMYCRYIVHDAVNIIHKLIVVKEIFYFVFVTVNYVPAIVEDSPELKEVIMFAEIHKR
jgi:hypothetical protein